MSLSNQLAATPIPEPTVVHFTDAYMHYMVVTVHNAYMKVNEVPGNTLVTP